MINFTNKFAAISLTTAAEIAEACKLVMDTFALAKAEAEAADVDRSKAPSHSGCWSNNQGGCTNGCTDCSTAIYYDRLVPAWNLQGECAAACGDIGTALAKLAWGPHPGGFFVTNQRLSWDGDRQITLSRHRITVALVFTDPSEGAGSARIMDPMKAKAKRDEAKAKNREAQASYAVSLNEVASSLAGNKEAFIRLAVAVETMEEVEVPKWLDYSPGQKGGTTRLGVSARGALKRAGELNLALAGIPGDLKALTLAQIASQRANWAHISPTPFNTHESKRTLSDAASAAKQAGDGWRNRALAIIASVK